MHFQETSTFAQQKASTPRKHKKALITRKSEEKCAMEEHYKQLSALTISSTANLVTFATELEPSAPFLPESPIPAVLPVLEDLPVASSDEQQCH